MLIPMREGGRHNHYHLEKEKAKRERFSFWVRFVIDKRRLLFDYLPESKIRSNDSP